MHKTLKKGGSLLQDTTSLFQTGYSQAKRTFARVSQKLTKANIKKEILVILEKLKPLYEKLCQTGKWTLPSLHSFVILLLVTFIRVQNFPGVEMYKSLIFVMLHRFLVNGVENIGKFKVIQDLMTRSKIINFFRKTQQQKSVSPQETELDIMQRQMKNQAAQSLSHVISDLYQQIDFHKISTKLAKLVMSIIILLLVVYFIEYYFPESLWYQRVVTPYISRLPLAVKDVLTRLVTFLQNKVPILQKIEVNWNSGDSSSSMTGASSSFFSIFLTMLTASIITNLLESSIFDEEVENVQAKITKENLNGHDDDDYDDL